MASENEDYTLKNNNDNDNDNDIVARLDLHASVLTMRPPRLQETNKRNS